MAQGYKKMGKINLHIAKEAFLAEENDYREKEEKLNYLNSEIKKKHIK